MLIENSWKIYSFDVSYWEKNQLRIAEIQTFLPTGLKRIEIT